MINMKKDVRKAAISPVIATIILIAVTIAIAVGGVLSTIYGWESCFYALIIYSCIVFVLSLFLPEAAPYLDKEALDLKNI